MTKQEAVQIIAVLQSNYPNSYSRQTKEQAEAMVMLWSAMFKDYSANIVTKALLSVIATKKDFPPTIADVNEEIRKMVKPETDIVKGETAWEQVVKVLQAFPVAQPYGLWNEDDKEAYTRFKANNIALNSDVAKRALNSIGGWLTIGNTPGEHLSILRSQFVKTYNELLQTQTNQALIPPSLAAEIDMIRQSNTPKIELVTEKIETALPETPQQELLPMPDFIKKALPVYIKKALGY